MRPDFPPDPTIASNTEHPYRMASNGHVPILQAAAVPYRMRDDRPEFCLVTSVDERQLDFSQGHHRPGRDPGRNGVEGSRGRGRVARRDRRQAAGRVRLPQMEHPAGGDRDADAGDGGRRRVGGVRVAAAVLVRRREGPIQDQPRRTPPVARRGGRTASCRVDRGTDNWWVANHRLGAMSSVAKIRLAGGLAPIRTTACPTHPTAAPCFRAGALDSPDEKPYT